MDTELDNGFFLIRDPVKYLQELAERVDEINEKMYEFEVNKRNNLIFYGIQSESRETPAMLLSKVRKHKKIFFKIKMKTFLGDKSSEDQHEYKEGNYGKSSDYCDWLDNISHNPIFAIQIEYSA